MDSHQLRQLLVLANEFKEGDLIVGGTEDDDIRREARQALASLTIGTIANTVLIEDQLSETLNRSINHRLQSEISNLTLLQFKNILLGHECEGWLESYREGLASEVIAAVVKVMTNDELSTVARRLFNPLPGLGITIGSPQHLGSRIQPNSPGDDEEEILFSILEGLSYGCGDVILGLNPASDDVGTIVRLEQLLQRVVERLELPTRYCVLSDIVKQTRAREQTRIDVGFQSLAGTSKAIRGMVGLDVDGVLDLARGFDGLYFETGQGSAVTNGTAEGLDMVTLEARTYGAARHIRQQTGKWMIVNDVAGFIGPEVFRTESQLLCACLEDSVMAKLHGLTMGLDVCSTFHMGIEPDALQRLTQRVAEQAAPAYLMAVAGNADPMLGYLTTSFREHPRLRRQTRRQVTSAMQRKFAELGIVSSDGELRADPNTVSILYAKYCKAEHDCGSFDALREEGTRKLDALCERGFDLGYGHSPGFEAPATVRQRLQAIYTNARQALYAVIEKSVIQEACPRSVRLRTRAIDRDDFLAHPSAGERLREKDACRVGELYPTSLPQIQFVISDGLNANAINENLHRVLPPLRQDLRAAGFRVGNTDIILTNGRVRAGYHIAAILGVDLLIHLIGERPGTGINTLSAYVTYGRDAAGGLRWSVDLDHSCTTASCGIHPKGKPPEAAAHPIAATIKRMFDQHCSGVALRAS